MPPPGRLNSNDPALLLLADLAQDAPQGSAIRDAAERLHLVRPHEVPVPSWCVRGAWIQEEGPFGRPKRITDLGPAYVHLEDNERRFDRVRYEHLSAWRPVNSPILVTDPPYALTDPPWGVRSSNPCGEMILHLTDDYPGGEFRREYLGEFLEEGPFVTDMRADYGDQDVMEVEEVRLKPIPIEVPAEKTWRTPPATRYERDLNLED